MKRLALVALPSLLFFTGCGGGGAPGSPSAGGFAKLDGTVVSADGGAGDVGGVLLVLGETGAVVATAPNGSFDFGVVPAGNLTLGVLPMGPAKHGDDDGPGDDHGGGGADDGPGHDVGDDHGGGSDDDDDVDEVEDGEHSTETEIEVHRVSDGEEIHVRLHLRGGRIEGTECSRSDRSERDAEVRLTRLGTADDLDVSAKVEVEARDDRQRLKIEVEHATPGRSLAVFAIDLAGSEESIGVRTVSALGEAEWRLDTDKGARLPFGLADVAALEGLAVEVRDAGSGIPLLRGEIPGLPEGIAFR